MPSSGHNQGPHAALAESYGPWCKYLGTFNCAMRLLTTCFSQLNRSSPVVSWPLVPRLCARRLAWVCTRDWVPCWEVSFPRWPSDSPPTSRTRLLSPIRRLVRSPARPPSLVSQKKAPRVICESSAHSSLPHSSWSRRRCDRSCRRRQPHGSRQDPSPSPTPQSGRPPRCPQVP